jgi:hypothetical protein
MMQLLYEASHQSAIFQVFSKPYKLYPLNCLLSLFLTFSSEGIEVLNAKKNILPITRARARLAFWLPVICLGVLLGPAEYILGTNSVGSHALVPFPWFVSTLGICFVSGVLCALLATLRMKSRRVGAIVLRGFLSSCCASLLNISLWLAYLLVDGIYTLYHPAPQVTSHWSWTFPPSCGLLVLGLLLFLAIASFHLIVTLLGGVLGGLINGIIVQIQSAFKGS